MSTKGDLLSQLSLMLFQTFEGSLQCHGCKMQSEVCIVSGDKQTHIHSHCVVQVILFPHQRAWFVRSVKRSHDVVLVALMPVQIARANAWHEYLSKMQKCPWCSQTIPGLQSNLIETDFPHCDRIRICAATECSIQWRNLVWCRWRVRLTSILWCCHRVVDLYSMIVLSLWTNCNWAERGRIVVVWFNSNLFNFWDGRAGAANKVSKPFFHTIERKSSDFAQF